MPAIDAIHAIDRISEKERKKPVLGRPRGELARYGRNPWKGGLGGPNGLVSGGGLGRTQEVAVLGQARAEIIPDGAGGGTSLGVSQILVF
jgi:hypothetical protein